MSAGSGADLLPVPMMNILNGGAHADNPIDFQEFMVMPVGAPTFSEALRCGTEIFHSLKSALHKAGLSTAVGDEGGFAPNIASAREALDFILRSVECAGYKAGDGRRARARLRRDRVLQGRQVRAGGRGTEPHARPKWRPILPNLADAYPIASIEDGMGEDDMEGWKALTDLIGDRVQLVGDDLFVTNEKRLAQGIENGIANSILVKVNQIGTLTETINAVRLAQTSGYTAVMSHRSGETEDFDHRRPRGRAGLRADQDGQPCAVRPDGQVQPAAADRGRAWRYSALPGDCGTESLQARLIHRIIHQRAIFPCLPEAFVILKIRWGVVLAASDSCAGCSGPRWP